jgi:hypothetical protein
VASAAADLQVHRPASSAGSRWEERAEFVGRAANAKLLCGGIAAYFSYFHKKSLCPVIDQNYSPVT